MSRNLYRLLSLQHLEKRRMLTTYVVDSLVDEVDFLDDATTLREAVLAANLQLGEDRIVFSPTLSGQFGNELSMLGEAIEVTDAVRIEGPGAERLTINASRTDPTPELNNGDGQSVFRGSELHLSGVTITGADARVIAVARGSLSHVVIEKNRFGGIEVGDGSLPSEGTWFVITDSEFRDNTFRDRGASAGGAIAAYSNLHIERTTIENNQAGHGAAIHTRHSIRIYDSSFLNNYARGDGGAIYTQSPSWFESTVEIYNSTFANNVTDGFSVGDGADGGALALRGHADVRIVGTTISGNEIRTAAQWAAGNGAGIHFTFADHGRLTIDRSTIVNNFHSGPRAGPELYGGLMHTAAQLVITNSVIADNKGGQIYIYDDGPAANRARHSFIGYSTEPDLPPNNGIPDANGNVIGSVDRPLSPKLGPLKDNGGGILTHLPLSDSPLIDRGDPKFNDDDVRMQFDQRGAPFERVVNGRLDMGATEYRVPISNELIMFEHDVACCIVHRPSTVDSGDVDGDGDDDLVVGLFADRAIVWYENRSLNGGYGSQRVVSASTGVVQHVRLVDLDGDGDLDVLAATYGDVPVAWFENEDSRGQFGPARVVSADGAYRAAAADIDGDGNLDVATLTAGGTLAWFRNEGGAASFFGPLTVTTELSGPESLELVDLSGDGAPDFLVGGMDNLVVAWYENEQQGGFTREHTVSAIVVDTFDSISADMDGDGDPDVVTAIVVEQDGEYFNDLIWLENTNGRGALTTGHPIASSLSGTQWIQPVDMDGDGDLDVAVALYFEETLVWFENRGGAANFTRRSIDTPASDAVEGTVADMDGDGDVDFALASYRGDRVLWLQSPTDVRRPWRAFQVTPPTPSILQTADINGDGQLDVVVASAVSGELHWLEYQGQETFGSAQLAAEWRSGTSVIVVADLDGDADADLVAATNSTIAWFANDGSGRFGEAKTIASRLEDIHSIEAIDLDNDGDRDLLVTADGSLSLHANTDGAGNFSDGPPVIISIQTVWSAVADIDRDGFVDIVAASENSVGWYRNQADIGGFAPAQEIENEYDYAVAASGDLDGDGDSDLVVATVENQFSRIYWYRNEGGVFSQRAQLGGMISAVDRITLADLNSDGDLDLLFAPPGTNDILWLKGLGGGEFKNALPIGLGDNEQLQVADLDNDGQPDLLFANSDRGRIGWWEQRLPGDSNNDGRFNSSDLITVFAAGEYEDGVANNSTFAEGDWNRDGDFDSSDLVLAFQAGHYLPAAEPVNAVVAAAVEWLFGRDEKVKRSRAGG